MGELHLGDQLWRADGISAAVERVAVEHAPRVMYNLSIEKAHTFFVGEDPRPVDNMCALGAGEAVRFTDLAARGHSGNKRRTPDEEALIDLAKVARRKGTSVDEARVLLEWARELGRKAFDHLGKRHWVGGDHIHN